MAVYYYLAIAGVEAAAATALARHFDGLTLTLADRSVFPCLAITQPDGEGAWWAIVRPIGASLNAVLPDGQPEPGRANRAQRSEIGHQLYARLRQAPPFRYAFYGPEALDAFFDVHSVYNIIQRDSEVIRTGWAGLVIDHTLWTQSGRPAGYQPFRPGVYWRPYAGEHRW